MPAGERPSGKEGDLDRPTHALRAPSDRELGALWIETPGPTSQPVGILVSEVACPAVAGKAFEFTDHGEVTREGLRLPGAGVEW